MSGKFISGLLCCCIWASPTAVSGAGFKSAAVKPGSAGIIAPLSALGARSASPSSLGDISLRSLSLSGGGISALSLGSPLTPAGSVSRLVAPSAASAGPIAAPAPAAAPARALNTVLGSVRKLMRLDSPAGDKKGLGATRLFDGADIPPETGFTGAPDPADALLEAARRSTTRRAADLLARRGRTEVHAVLASKDTKTITEYRGVPRRVEPLETGDRVFRHWVRKKEDLRAILDSGYLKAGPTPYVEFTGSSRAYIKDIYLDLQGVFFTGTETSPTEPRVMNEDLKLYVDFRIPPGIAALDMDLGQVLMIPGTFSPETRIPVEIVGSSLGG